MEFTLEEMKQMMNAFKTKASDLELKIYELTIQSSKINAELNEVKSSKMFLESKVDIQNKEIEEYKERIAHLEDNVSKLSANKIKKERASKKTP